MKSKNTVRISLFHKAQPPSRFFWMGLIFCLPWIVGAQAPISEPMANNSEQKVAVDEKAAQPADVAAKVDEKAAQPADDAAKPVEPLANIVVEKVQPSTPPVVEPLAEIIQEQPVKEPLPAIVQESAKSVPETAPVIANESPKPLTETVSKEDAKTEPVAEKSAYAAQPSAPAIVAEPVVKTKPAEKSPAMCRMPNPSEPPSYRSINASIGMAPLSHGNLDLELLYWEGIEDSLRYAVKNWPQNWPLFAVSVVNVNSPSVNQKLSYDPGARAAIIVPILYDEWELGAIYTYFYTTPHVTNAYDPSGSMWPNLNNAFFPNPNPPVAESGYSIEAVKGKWNLKMNVFDLEFRRPFVIGKALMLQPIMGAKACFIRQKVDVHYTYIIPTAGTNNRAIGRSSVWGAGPELGLEMRFLIPKQVSISIRGAFATMLGLFSNKTLYTEYMTYENVIPYTPFSCNEEVVLMEKKTRLFEMGQLQCGLSKWWSIKNDSSLELTLGWEAQIWWRQMRMNWLSTTAYPPEGADLTLQGPFFKGSWNF